MELAPSQFHVEQQSCIYEDPSCKIRQKWKHCRENGVNSCYANISGPEYAQRTYCYALELSTHGFGFAFSKFKDIKDLYGSHMLIDQHKMQCPCKELGKILKEHRLYLRPAQHYSINFLPASFHSSDKIRCDKIAKVWKRPLQSFSGSRDDDVKKSSKNIA